MITTLWTFSAMDSLFFRDGSPMNISESAWVNSQFPPSGQTLQGAIRAAILDFLDADIPAFQRGEDCLPNNGGSLKHEIGHGSSLGSMQLTGPFLSKNEELFFPAPLDLVKNQQDEYALLKPSPIPVPCDAGNIRLPAVSGSGYKTQQGNYISTNSMQNLLQGESDSLDLIPLIAPATDHEGLADRESKVGLARNNATRTNIEGMLFAIAPVRPRQEVALQVQVEGVHPEHHPPDAFMQKLGGEAKLAKISTGGDLQMPTPHINEQADCIRFKIVFTSPALFSDGSWLPEDFTIQKQTSETGRYTIWQGVMRTQGNDCPLKIISACIDKPQKIGGWNLQQRKPKDLRSFIPAGSVFFCEAAVDQKNAVLALHNSKTGNDTEYGFGHILIGKW